MTWQIDFAHSEINFTVRHMMISKVRGQFESFDGTVNFDPDNPANTTVNIRVDTSSINTKEGQRDGHLKSPDFLDVETYPTMTFTSTRVEQTGDDTARLVGDLTIRGVTKEVVLNVEYAGQAKSPWGTTSAGFSASGKINRKDWGLTWNQALETGGVLVGDEIKIDIELELVQVAEPMPA
ncbi:MAG: polyisoprenoid-binding protein [Anaerolineales bacterium]|nr:polyisoprenoid-binding protein [Anaerolineales bacterium]